MKETKHELKLRELLRTKQETIQKMKSQANWLVDATFEQDLFQRVENINELARKLSQVNQQIFELGYEEKG